MKVTSKQWKNNVGVRIPNGRNTLQVKPKKTFSDIAEPLMSTKGWKFDREEANERR